MVDSPDEGECEFFRRETSKNAVLEHLCNTFIYDLNRGVRFEDYHFRDLLMQILGVLKEQGNSRLESPLLMALGNNIVKNANNGSVSNGFNPGNNILKNAKNRSVSNGFNHGNNILRNSKNRCVLNGFNANADRGFRNKNRFHHEFFTRKAKIPKDMINTTGRLQKLLLCDGPVLNLAYVSHKDGNLRSCAFGHQVGDLCSLVGVLVDLHVCKIRYVLFF